jgi:hypothetical protein
VVKIMMCTLHTLLIVGVVYSTLSSLSTINDENSFLPSSVSPFIS